MILRFNYDYFMELFEFVVSEWIYWWRHNTNPGYQVQPFFLQEDQPIWLQYSHQIKLFKNALCY